MTSNLPVELWILIFHYALTDSDNVLFSTSLPTSMSDCSWFKTDNGSWALRIPQDVSYNLQRKRYSILKSIVSTCKYWRQISLEYLFASLFLEDPLNILRLCATMDSNHYVGRWAKRLHITRYYPRGTLSADDLELSLVSVIQHCRGLQIFVVEWSLLDSFTPVVDALSTYCSRSLRVLHIHVRSRQLARLFWALESLICLESIHLEFGQKETEDIHLGSASNIVLTLPTLECLSLRGFFSDFIEQAVDWSLPCLRSLTLDFASHHDELADIPEFLQNHGAHLKYLDINCIPVVDVPAILDLCPSLTTFAFNADWRLAIDDIPYYEASVLVRRPHPNITTIGLHELRHAFGVNYYATHDILTTNFARRTNDLNFAALNTRNFPKLERVRLLSRTVLRDLETANGPDDVCFERWERWWAQCARQKVRLEDCTGAEFGNLPEEDDEEDEETDGDEEELEGGPLVVPGSFQGDAIAQIRLLTSQCRQLTTVLHDMGVIAT